MVSTDQVTLYCPRNGWLTVCLTAAPFLQLILIFSITHRVVVAVVLVLVVVLVISFTQTRWRPGQ